jgi:hypothetical protein
MKGLDESGATVDVGRHVSQWGDDGDGSGFKIIC